ncbi:YqgE/AlgH family protein [Pseudoxanthomonas sacheonensis]|uniref:YqgE/AlgH family protein n=1 Tax=Pseudoxanthomonas sacheonensis TaxID=443615 RepID=UPI0013D79F0D|nr:YqgE/AlgH family protein [Pseudoxanthomonas sacheonensis]KAF1712948.1 YqgE/AlgH family protein [Pseudoxanthomonas sacheonensis]
MSAISAKFSNQLLIALPALNDPHFARSVALICQHDEEGAMGVVVNRASEYTLGDVLAQMNLEVRDPALGNQIVLNGGPVHPERGFVLHDGGRQWDSTLAIGDGLALTTSRDILEAMAEGAGPEHVVVALGCAGWGAGQLEYELGENSWLTAPADYELLFALPLEQRWQAAGGRIGVDITRVTDYSGHA